MKKTKAKLYFGPGEFHWRLVEFPNEKELCEFLDQLFTVGYGYAEISKKLYVNMANIHYVEIED